MVNTGPCGVTLRVARLAPVSSVLPRVLRHWAGTTFTKRVCLPRSEEDKTSPAADRPELSEGGVRQEQIAPSAVKVKLALR